MERLTRLTVLVSLINLGACRTGGDTSTPEGAYIEFTQAMSARDFRTVYGRLDSLARANLRIYYDSTRASLELIDARYPPTLRQTALEDLMIPFQSDSFTMADFRLCPTDTSLFEALCQSMFSGQSRLLSFALEMGTTISAINRPDDSKAILRSVAGDSLTFTKEPDGGWRTSEVFGPAFSQLALLSRRNLTVLRANVEVFTQ